MSAPRDQYADAVAHPTAREGDSLSTFFAQREEARQVILDQLVARDGACCQGCDLMADDPAQFEIDHVLPRALGGPDAVDNYQLLCRRCNQRKGDKHPDQWRAVLVRDAAMVTATLRTTMAAAAAVRPRIPSVEWAVLAAVIARLAGTSQLSDDVHVRDVALAARVLDSAGRPDVKETDRRLRALRDRGLVIYEPSSYREWPPRIGLPAPTSAAGGERQ